jgi:hypothetical protein
MTDPNKHTPIDWASLEETEWLRQAEQQIWLSAFASNNPRAPAHQETDRAYADAKARGAGWMYSRAYIEAYKSCGFTPSLEEIAAAQKPLEAAKEK